MNYEIIYEKLIERAKERVPDGYVERHHILPRCMGGSDEKENLVALYPEEHFLAHVLLLKIYKNTVHRHSLAKAVQKMCSIPKNHFGKRINRKLYGWLKREHSLAMSEMSKGEGNSQFGTRWICNIETQENKKIQKTEEISSGWVEGRNKWVKKEKYDRPCSACGNVTCQNDTCNKIILVKVSLVPYFGFDKTMIGTIGYINEYERVYRYIYDLYHVHKMSLREISISHGLSSSERCRTIMKSLGIERDLSRKH